MSDEEVVVEGAFSKSDIDYSIDLCREAQQEYIINDTNSTAIEMKTSSQFFFKDNKGKVAGAVEKKGQKLLITFIGNTKASDILNDLNIQPSSIGRDENVYHVHKGFHDWFKDREDSMNEAINKLDPNNKLEKVFSGHSAGAAMAQIAFLDRKIKLPNDKSSVITFGGPRVFFRNSARKFRESFGLNSLEIKNTLDPIVKLPPPPLFSHVSFHRIKTRLKKWINPHIPSVYKDICNQITQKELNDAHNMAIKLKEREDLGKEIRNDRSKRIKEALKEASNLNISKSLSIILDGSARNTYRNKQKDIDKSLKGR